MKKTIHLSVAMLFIASVFTLSSCTKSLTAKYTVADYTSCVSASTGAQNYQVSTFTINHNDLITTLNNAGAKDVSRVLSMNLNQMSAVISNGGNFDNITDVEVYLKTSNDLQDSIQIGYSSNITPGATQITLQMTGTDFKAAISYDPIVTVKILNKTTGNTACVKLTQGVIAMGIRE